MDYPKSLPGIGLVGGKFVDANPTTGAPGSWIAAAWANSLMDELLGVINAAGLVPSEADNGQVFQALKTIFVQANVFKGSNQSLSANGYQIFPGGLILQWGSIAGASGGVASIVFPIAFPNAAFHASSLYVAGADPGTSAPPTIGGTLFGTLAKTGVNVRFGPGFTNCRYLAWGF